MDSKPKTPQWRFSLRELLIGMSLISLFLAIFCWKWQETRTLYLGFDSDPVRTITTTTTYRRSWTGARHKHGREFTTGYDGKLLFESFYRDGRLLLERKFSPAGSIEYEKSYLPSPAKTTSR